MKTRLLIITTIVIVTAILIISSFVFFRSVDDIPMICEDKILNSDQCHKYLNEKYTAIPAVSHFLKISDYQGLGMEVKNFKVTKIAASTIEGKLVSHMEIDTATSTIIYKCVALEDNEEVFVEIENPTIEDIDSNRCYSFDSEHLKSREELRCEQIGGELNHPEYEGCVLPSVICGYDPDDGSTNNSNENCEQTSREMCKDMGGKIVKNLSCRESVREQYAPDPAPCDFRGPAGCEFPE